MDEERVLARLQSFEGSTVFMYRCTGGEVTTGVGHAMPSAADAIKLNWQINGRAASSAEVTTDFGKVAAAALGMLAADYEPLTQCRLNAGDVASMATADIAAFEAELRKTFPAWDSYPEPAQEAIFDMAFNLGVPGLRSKFPKFMAAVQARNWQTAAAESERRGIADARNREIAALLRQAGSGSPSA
jgi:GH24 family phage-related lysozyme (muramidase)